METKSMSKAVRVVARVKPSSSDPAVEASSASSVSVHKRDQSETVSVSFGAQFAGSKDSCELDYFYEENESASSILTKEIKPLISSVFEGKDANVIAHGARCSGKTLLIQGSEWEPGLVILSMAEMLSMAEERGDSVSVSFYEVSQETVYDIIDQEKRMVPVKSLSGFQEVYFGLNKIQKLVNDPPLRSHRGVMIHVSKGEVHSGSFGRMNFLDVAGYEDSRKQCSDAPLEITRINKSIYALQNVLYAINANESHVPYRESKLTHMLKGCLQGSNRTLLITCLPREFSQDSFYMLNLASRICLGSKQSMTNATKKSKCPARSLSSSSAAQNKYTPLAVSATSRQQTGIRKSVTERKSKLKTPASAIKGRKLFGEANDSLNCKNSSKKEISTPKVVLNVQASSSEEEVCSSVMVTDSQSSTVEEETPLKHEEGVLEDIYCDDAIACKAQIVERGENRSVIEENLTLVNEGESLDKENNCFLANETASPPLSLQLRELSMNLKLLFNSSNLPSPPEKYQTALTKTHVEELPQHSEITAEAELKTPERSMPSKINCTPWKTFSAHSSKLKNSAVGEYLKFLNTADKEDLKKLKGIGEKRATYIVELRQESPEPFKELDDLKDIGLSEKQIKGLLRKEIGDIFQ
uniref:Kinesin motor domain-containing protein n=1 Tax=Brassica campestris TaxID=3711 RepID=M4ECG7_BRACM